ncbi:sodium:calcium antiporter [Puniceibacterium sediminis]|uniref:Cation:H+ antiporter n=1 Tax=Puniceibacterium sediminis TaxID=1608407 RepID=A0A238VFT3_9RHOB|nr:cation transporter [Puniceibacterium sediminis]SNR33071.1 cation:H+ antiporter [Puniceibacterium sediminis]
MISALSLPLLLCVLALAGGIVVLASIKLTELADIIADRTRMGEALVGGLILGGATSVAGIVVSINAALSGDASFAFSNAVGGIAAQTLFLAIGDVVHRRANLEHAAAEPAILFQSVLLIVLLSIPLAAMAGPDIAYFGIHPASVLLFLAYIAGVRISRSVSEAPMWRPVHTDETRKDLPEDKNERHRPARGAILRFAALAAVMAAGGWVISQVGGTLITRYSLSSSLVGALITAVATSLPELVTTLAAVRRGALQLAVGGIIGGNSFDTLVLVASDVAYRDGSLFHAISLHDLFWLCAGLMMTAVLLGGLIVRQKAGPGRIGVESVLVMVIYATALLVELTA